MIITHRANSSQNDLVNQLDGISNSMYTDLDQEIITGARLKQVVNQAKSTDCAIVVASLGCLGAQAGLGDAVGYIPASSAASATAKPEATLNGNVGVDFIDGKAPVVQLENMTLKTSLDSTISYPLAVNFGSILKNSVTGKDNADDSIEWQSMVDSEDGTASKLAFVSDSTYGSGESGEKVASGSAFVKYDDTAEYGQTLYYKDGQFLTKLEFATDASSRVLRYEMTSDFTKSGKTFTISDTAQFNSYVITNAAGEYMGLVFCQRRK